MSIPHSYQQSLNEQRVDSLSYLLYTSSSEKTIHNIQQCVDLRKEFKNDDTKTENNNQN